MSPRTLASESRGFSFLGIVMITTARSPYLEALADRVLVFDGAMGTSIQNYNLTPEDFGGQALEGCNDYLVITRPDVVGEVHASFMDAGCDVLETDTFRSNRLTLREYALQDRVREINVAAAQLARGVADRFAARVEDPAAHVAHLSDRRVEAVVEHEQVVVRVERQVVRIERSLGLGRCERERFGEQAGSEGRGRAETDQEAATAG